MNNFRDSWLKAKLLYEVGQFYNLRNSGNGIGEFQLYRKKTHIFFRKSVRRIVNYVSYNRKTAPCTVAPYLMSVALRNPA